LQGAILTATIFAFAACNSTGNSPGTPPSALTYDRDTAVFAKGVLSNGVGATVTGTVITYTVSPALPAGLTLDTVNGTIAGRATVAKTATNYVVSAVNASGSTSATLNIAVLTRPDRVVSSSSSATVARTTATSRAALDTFQPVVRTEEWICLRVTHTQVWSIIGRIRIQCMLRTFA